MKLYREGIRANLPQSLYTEQVERVEMHRTKDNLIEDFVEQLEAEAVEGLPLTDIISQAPPALQRLPRWDKLIASTLRTRGWEKKQVQRCGKRQRLWIPPQKETEISVH